jgi:hypothetical protein
MTDFFGLPVFVSELPHPGRTAAATIRQVRPRQTGNFFMDNPRNEENHVTDTFFGSDSPIHEKSLRGGG